MRGCIDGDGSITTFTHKASKRIQLKIRLVSASYVFLFWIRKNIKKHLKTKEGSISRQKHKGVFTLLFGKNIGRKIIDFMYYSNNLSCLTRKRKIADKWASGEIG